MIAFMRKLLLSLDGPRQVGDQCGSSKYAIIYLLKFFVWHTLCPHYGERSHSILLLLLSFLNFVSFGVFWSRGKLGFPMRTENWLHYCGPGSFQEGSKQSGCREGSAGRLSEQWLWGLWTTKQHRKTWYVKGFHGSSNCSGLQEMAAWWEHPDSDT